MKHECVGHVQKQLGTQLRTLKKSGKRDREGKVVKGVSLIKSLMQSKCIMAVLFKTIRMTFKEWSKLFRPSIITPSQLTQFHNMTFANMT